MLEKVNDTDLLIPIYHINNNIGDRTEEWNTFINDFNYNGYYISYRDNCDIDNLMCTYRVTKDLYIEDNDYINILFPEIVHNTKYSVLIQMHINDFLDVKEYEFDLRIKKDIDMTDPKIELNSSLDFKLQGKYFYTYDEKVIKRFLIHKGILK